MYFEWCCPVSLISVSMSNWWQSVVRVQPCSFSATIVSTTAPFFLNVPFYILTSASDATKSARPPSPLPHFPHHFTVGILTTRLLLCTSFILLFSSPSFKTVLARVLFPYRKKEEGISVSNAKSNTLPQAYPILDLRVGNLYTSSQHSRYTKSRVDFWHLCLCMVMMHLHCDERKTTR